MKLGNTENGVDEVARWMQALKPSQRAQLLSLLSHQLTVSVRALCHEGKSSSEAVERIRLLNEVHHRVAGYLIHLLLNDRSCRDRATGSYARRAFPGVTYWDVVASAPPSFALRALPVVCS